MNKEERELLGNGLFLAMLRAAIPSDWEKGDGTPTEITISIPAEVDKLLNEVASVLQIDTEKFHSELFTHLILCGLSHKAQNLDVDATTQALKNFRQDNLDTMVIGGNA